jgi:hypothetical protein
VDAENEDEEAIHPAGGRLVIFDSRTVCVHQDLNSLMPHATCAHSHPHFEFLG